jgi:hypothetical protein
MEQMEILKIKFQFSVSFIIAFNNTANQELEKSNFSFHEYFLSLSTNVQHTNNGFYRARYITTVF